MMKHSGISSICFALILGAASATHTSNAKAASLPPEALAFPADTLGVLSLDVKRLLASPLYRNSEGRGAARKTLDDLCEWIGLNAERDIDRLFLALGAPSSVQTDDLLLLYGRFDHARMKRSLLGGKTAPAAVKEISGTKTYILKGRKESQTVATAVCLLNPKTVLLGPPSAVDRMLKARLVGRRPLRTNLSLSRLFDQVQPDADLWLIADAALLRRLPRGRSATGALPTLDLPQLRHLILTGAFADALRLKLIGMTTDEATARNTADMVRGLLTLATMTARRLEWRKVAASVEVTTTGSRVRLDARIPYPLLQGLPASFAGAVSKKNKPTTAPPPGN